MTVQTEAQSPAEQTLVRIVRTLPPERAWELVNFARFLQWQVSESDENQLEGETGGGEERGGQLLAEPEAQRSMIEMAREAREEYHAGRTTDISITKDGRLAPG
jgi:hypothetical protein